MKQNNPGYLFGMYEPDTDSVIVNAINDTYTDTPHTISCKQAFAKRHAPHKYGIFCYLKTNNSSPDMV